MDDKELALKGIIKLAREFAWDYARNSYGRKNEWLNYMYPANSGFMYIEIKVVNSGKIAVVYKNSTETHEQVVYTIPIRDIGNYDDFKRMADLYVQRKIDEIEALALEKQRVKDELEKRSLELAQEAIERGHL